MTNGAAQVDWYISGQLVKTGGATSFKLTSLR